MFCASEQTANIQLIGEENSVYKHEEADCNIIRYVKQFINEGKKHIQIQADDTDIFFLPNILLQHLEDKSSNYNEKGRWTDHQH